MEETKDLENTKNKLINEESKLGEVVLDSKNIVLKKISCEKKTKNLK